MKTHNAKPGDFIEVHLTRVIYEGVLLEAPESEKGIVLLKLNSGYNIGFNQKDILEIRVLKKSKEKDSAPPTLPKMGSAKPNIAMIITGGTIAARLNPRKGGVDWLDSPESLFKFYPSIFDKVNLVKVEIPFMKASEDMDFKDWQKLARVTKKLLDDKNIRGVVITHGTDFLHYTSAALSFFLRDLSKPVVLTYSQRSIDRASSDANLNLQCAVLAATSDIAEVMLVGHATGNDDYCFAMPGTKVRKLHTSKRDAFKIVNGKPFAKITEDRIDILSGHNLRGGNQNSTTPPTTTPKKLATKSSKNKITLDSKFEEKVAMIKIYPGQDAGILDYYVKKKYKGLVLEVSGLGHLPTKRARNSWIKKLKEIQEKGIIVCAAAQCINGRLDPLVYSNGREILETGVIYLNDILSETALVKLGWVLGHADWAKDKEIVKEKMLHNFAHEFSDRLE
jgi:glutamyl-tRNA(Gln) amidotransferase subunit D